MKTKYFFLSFFLFSLVASAQDINQDLIVHYSFDGTYNDVSGNGRHATNAGTSFSPDRFGNPDSAISFDGVDDYIILPNIAELKPDLPISFSFWVKYNNLNTSDTDLFNTSFEDDRNSGVYLTLQASTGNYAVGFGDGSATYSSSTRRSFVSNSPAIPNQWNHVVIVIASATNMNIYVNCEDNGGVHSGSGGALYYSPFSGNIGRHDRNNNVPANYFNGALDDFKYWSRALTVAEITAEFCAGTLGDDDTDTTRIVEPKIFPNPSTGIFNIDVGTEVIDKVLVYDLQGKLLPTKKLNKAVDLSQFSSGIYVVKIITPSKIYSKRVILEK